MSDPQTPAATGVAVVPARKLALDQVVAAPGRGGGATFLPRTMQECLDFATIMSKSDFAIPPAFRNNPGACLAVTIQASRWEADPFGVIQKAYITKAKDGSERLAYESQLFGAIVNTRAPLAGRLNLIYSGDGGTRAVKVVGVFRATGEVREVQTPGVSKIKKQSPLWTDDPDQQLAYYGIRAWARRWVPELMLGIYTPEDFQDDLVENLTRPTRDAVQVESRQVIEGEGVVRREEPVEVRATPEDILGKAEDLTAPITEEPKPTAPITQAEAGRLDDMRQGGGDMRQETEGDPRDGENMRGEEPGRSEADDELEGWEGFLRRSIETLDEGELKLEPEFEEFVERTKESIKAAPIPEDNRDDLRARFVSAWLNKKRQLFGGGAKPGRR